MIEQVVIAIHQVKISRAANVGVRLQDNRESMDFRLRAGHRLNGVKGDPLHRLLIQLPERRVRHRLRGAGG